MLRAARKQRGRYQRTSALGRMHMKFKTLYHAQICSVNVFLSINTPSSDVELVFAATFER